MTEKRYAFAGISPKSCVFLSFLMGYDRHIQPFGASDPKYVRRIPSQMTEKPYDFALFCPKRTTVQRFSSIFYEKARQYNKFHRSCMKMTTVQYISLIFYEKKTTVQQFS